MQSCYFACTNMRGVLGHVRYQAAAANKAWREADCLEWYLCRTDLVARFPGVDPNASKRDQPTIGSGRRQIFGGEILFRMPCNRAERQKQASRRSCISHPFKTLSADQS